MRPQEGAHPDPVDDAPNVYTDHEFPIAGRHVDYSGAVHRHAGVVAGDVELAEMMPPDATGQIKVIRESAPEISTYQTLLSPIWRVGSFVLW